jgi:hypothetical protein
MKTKPPETGSLALVLTSPDDPITRSPDSVPYNGEKQVRFE